LGSSSQTNSGKNRGKASRRRQHQPKENKQNHESKPANTLPAQSFAFGSGSGEKKFSFGGSPASFSQEGEEMDIGTTETQPDPPVNPTTPFRKKIPASSKKKKSAVGTATGSKSHRKNSAQSSHAMQELDNMFARIQVDGLSSGDDVGAGVEGRDQQAQRPFFYFPADSNDERRDAESEASRATNQERNDMGKNDPNDRIDEVTMKMSELAESYKIQGKKDYSSQHYDLAYDSFTKALDAAPPQWREKANVLSNRAAALIMMERLVEAIQDCEAATVVDPEFVKVHSRRGRAYLKLGKIEEATDAFMLVLGWTVSTEESNANDKFGREIARQAMKQVVLAKTLRDRLVNASKSNVKQNLQTAEELLALCPYMREAQTHKARALCQQHKWDEAKHFMEYCVCAIHPSMQKLHAHSCTELSLVKLENLSWHVDSSGVLRVRTDAVCMALLSMGSSMAQCYLTTLKNQAICRTSCSADVMLRLTEVLNAAIDRTFQPHTTSTVDIGWDWVVSELSKIQLIISIKNDADSKFRSGMFVEAIQRYGDVLQVDPDAHVWNAIMFGNKAASAMRLGLFSEAVSDCHQSLARDPEYSRAYLRRARAQRALGNHSASVRDYRKYLKSVPKPPDATSVEEELLEVLRAKSDEERCRRGAPNWNSNGRGPTYESRENYDTRGNARSQQEKPSSSYYAYRESGAHKNRKKTTPQKNERQEKGHSQGKQIEPEVTSANYYRRLGLHVTATDQEIKAAYRKMALKFHPDKNKDEGAAEIFKSVTEAYSVLTDKSNRRMYDDANTYGRESRRSRR